jgi:AcrR family transcriptional regulator
MNQSNRKKKKPAKTNLGRKTDERVERSKKAVLAAAHQLLTEGGLGGVSVDEVSKRSGVAKTTIYRHWPSRTALLLEACSSLSARPQAPDTGAFRSDLETMTLFVAERLSTAAWASVMPSIIDAAERDPELARLQAQIHGEMRGAFRTIVERGQSRREVDAQINPTEFIAAVLGPLFYRRWISREALDEQFVRNVVERAVQAATRTR